MKYAKASLSVYATAKPALQTLLCMSVCAGDYVPMNRKGPISLAPVQKAILRGADLDKAQ